MVNTSSPSFDTYFANLTIENGRNSNDVYVNTSSINYAGGIIDGFNNAGTYLTLVNVTLNHGNCQYSTGGALEVGNLGNTALTFEAG